MAESGCLRDMKVQNLEVGGTVTGVRRPVIAWSAARSLLASESGSLVHATDATAGILTLPTAAAGLEYHISIGIAQTGDTHISASGNGYFLGGLNLVDPATAGDMNFFTPDGNSNDYINLDSDAKGRLAGGVIRIICDGTNWHVSGTLVGDGTLATPFADAES